MNLDELVISGDFCPYPRYTGLEKTVFLPSQFSEATIFSDFYNKMASEQEDIPPEFEDTFRKHYLDLLANFGKGEL